MKKEERDPSKTEPPRTRTEKQAGETGAPEAPKRPRYEFKILPVDPKNSFDFEDVADK